MGLIVIAGLTIIWWQMGASQSVVKLDGASYDVSIMRTDEELTRGLSGTKNLPSGQAMLFEFSQDYKWQMWMKDMNYPIDMVWFNSNDKVVYMVKNAEPSSYPKTIFTPSLPARYVIEFPSGTIEKTGIKIGDLANLPSGV